MAVVHLSCEHHEKHPAEHDHKPNKCGKVVEGIAPHDRVSQTKTTHTATIARAISIQFGNETTPSSVCCPTSQSPTKSLSPKAMFGRDHRSGR